MNQVGPYCLQLFELLKFQLIHSGYKSALCTVFQGHKNGNTSNSPPRGRGGKVRPFEWSISKRVKSAQTRKEFVNFRDKNFFPEKNSQNIFLSE
jgi:hypothetical protein